MLIMSHKLINIYLYWCLRKLCNYCRLEYGITFGWKKLSGWSLLMRGCLHRRMRMCTFCTVYSLYCVHVLCRPQGGGHTCGLSSRQPDGSQLQAEAILATAAAAATLSIKFHSKLLCVVTIKNPAVQRCLLSDLICA